MPDLYSPAAVAALKGCSLRAVKYAIQRGYLPARRVLAGPGKFPRWAIEEKHLDVWGPDPERQSRLK